jgi:hypothetical protein
MNNFKEYLTESDKYYVHVNYLKGNDKTDLKELETKLTDTFMELKYDDVPSSATLVNAYKTDITDTKFYFTIVFELKGAGNIVTTPRKKDIIIQTSHTSEEIS